MDYTDDPVVPEEHGILGFLIVVIVYLLATLGAVGYCKMNKMYCFGDKKAEAKEGDKEAKSFLGDENDQGTAINEGGEKELFKAAIKGKRSSNREELI